MRPPNTIPPKNNKGYPLAYIEVKQRQSRTYIRYKADDISRIKWDNIDAARALYKKVGGFDGKNTIWHYDITRL